MSEHRNVNRSIPALRGAAKGLDLFPFPVIFYGGKVQVAIAT